MNIRKRFEIKPPIERFAWIARHILTNRSFTIKRIAEDLEVHDKTVRRDLEFMRDRLGYEFFQSDGIWRGDAPPERIL